MNWLMTVGGMLLIFTATVLLSSFSNPSLVVPVLFLGDLIVGIALLVFAFSE